MGLAVVSFFVVSALGTAIGIVYGLLASFCTKYTHHSRVLEPAFVCLLAFMAYLTAEMFHLSGIVSILFLNHLFLTMSIYFLCVSFLGVHMVYNESVYEKSGLDFLGEKENL